MRTRRIAFASRELHPFATGGIAPITAALARTLADLARVTIFTTSAYRDRCAELGGPEAIYGPGVELVFVDEPPPGRAGFMSYMHAWSAALWEAIADHFPTGGPDLIEFADYLAEGFVTLQAKRAADPLLADTLVVVRVHTTSEMCSVLNGAIGKEFESEAVTEAERYCLRNADRLLYSGGDAPGTYERFYGRDSLAPFARVLEAFHVESTPGSPPSGKADDPLRLLYIGRLERRKGVQNLVRALLSTGYLNWSLTILGSDTPTAPMRTSMRDYLGLIVDDDERFVFRDQVPRHRVGALIEAHDVVVVPSIWECWPNVVREAMLHDRPVVATPVGGLTEMVRHDETGWLAHDTSPEALIATLERLFENPERVRRVIASGAVRRDLDRIADDAETKRAYLKLLDGRQPTSSATSTPMVSVVVPYYAMDKYVEETLSSVRAQTYPNVEVIVVNDGSLRVEDRLVFELAERGDLRLVTQPNTGLGAARNLGISQSLGKYVLPLDSDNLIEPEFIERCVQALEADGSIAYVTSWSQYIDEGGERLPLPECGYTPYGNWSRLVDCENVAGDGTAVIQRRLFDLGFAYSTELTSFEDWFFYRELHHHGYFGAVIPQRLFLYRVRNDSMLRTTGTANMPLIHDEMNALLRRGAMQWATLPNV